MHVSNYRDAAISYAAEGIFIHPLHPGKKTPLLNDWPNKATTDFASIEKWWGRWPKANIGIHLGKSGLVVVDVDPRNGGHESLEVLKKKHGNWLSRVTVDTSAGGKHFYFAQGLMGHLPSVLAPGIDLKHGSGYTVAPPSVHPSGEIYTFGDCDILNGEISFLPSIPTWVTGSTECTAIGEVIDDSWALSCDANDPETTENVDRVKSALAAISSDCDRSEWRNILFAILSTGWNCSADIAREWSLSAPARFDETGFRNVLESAKADKANGITLGTLFAKASLSGWQDPRKTKSHVDNYGDISNGRRFAAKYRGSFLYVHATKEWYSWDGMRWAPCNSGQAMAAAKAIADECLDEAGKALRQNQTETAKRNFNQALSVHRSVKRLELMLIAASSEAAMSIPNPSLLDADPWKLGVRNGVIDLRTGRLLSAHPGMLISRQAGSTFELQPRCDLWLKFLSEVMQGDQRKVTFLQRMCGYALTGSVDEEKLFFMYGLGANGKSVFANILNAVAGDYGVTVRATLLARDPKGNSSDAEREKARLPGARVVLINETGQGDIWDDQRIKEAVSRERISARQLYAESFDFMPTHKLFVRGNHQPGAMDGSDGFWRRIVLLGFTHQIQDSDRIIDLDRKIIEHELPGVLMWMVDGCLQWQKCGLDIPPDIVDAVKAYRKDTDLLGEWLDSRCVLKADGESPITELFPSYERFLKEANTRAPSRNTFGRHLVQRGFRKRVSNGQTLYWASPVSPDTFT